APRPGCARRAVPRDDARRSVACRVCAAADPGARLRSAARRPHADRVCKRRSRISGTAGKPGGARDEIPVVRRARGARITRPPDARCAEGDRRVLRHPKGDVMKHALVILAVAIASASTSAQNSQFKDWKSAALADATQAKPHVACGSLVALTGYEFSVTTATVVAASADAPEYCRVVGLIQPEIRFEVGLPSAWNGRLYMFGNGGYAGEALEATGRVATARRALARGFATAQMNTGHDAAVEPLATFAASPQKLVDYAYRGMHVTALTAKRILQSYYDAAARRSYFDGCSTGGRQGLISAQRFPDDFDGIVVGAPVLNFSGTMISYLAIQRALAAAPIPASKLKALGDAVYARCDEA